MSIADITENNVLKLIFNATAWTNVASGDATGVTTPITVIAVALHTADPGDAGTQSTSESTYSNYLRQGPARTTGGWTASTAGSTSPVANIDFPSSGAAGTTITHFSVGKTVTIGATDIFWSGTVTPNIAIGAAGVIPRLTPASTVTLD